MTDIEQKKSPAADIRPLELTRLKLYCMELTSLLIHHNIQPPRIASDDECRRTMEIFPVEGPASGYEPAWWAAFDTVTERAAGVDKRRGPIERFYQLGGFSELTVLRHPPRDK